MDMCACVWHVYLCSTQLDISNQSFKEAIPMYTANTWCFSYLYILLMIYQVKQPLSFTGYSDKYKLVCFFVFFFLAMTCESLVPRLRIEPIPSALGIWTLIHQTVREVS